jgi:hypothetical protein
MTKGYCGGHPFDRCLPIMISGSVPQMATALILQRTSPAAGVGTGNSRIANVLIPVSMHAFIVLGITTLSSLISSPFAAH